TADPTEVQLAEKIVLPGVGHFASTKTLDDSGLRETIIEQIEHGIPFLGICVGMQWMLASSEEAPDVHGLALWPGECSRFPSGEVGERGSQDAGQLLPAVMLRIAKDFNRRGRGEKPPSSQRKTG